GLRLVGTVPPPPDARARAAAAGADWQMVLTESVDVIRTLLLHGFRGGPARTVMVTSAQGGEGKTSLAGHLGGSLARGGFRTLLIDGDLRRPSVHRVLGLPQSPGLCELLRGQVAPDAAIRPTDVDRLSVLPAGAWTPAVAQLLAR